MADVLTSLGAVDWAGAVVDVLVPVAAIIVSTLVAVRLASQERRDNRASLRRERLLAAARPLFHDLAPFVSIDARNEPIWPVLRSMRANIAAFRAALGAEGEDALVSDWLGLRHREGMTLWGKALASVPQVASGRETGLIVQPDTPALASAKAWANTTMQQLQGWLSGYVGEDWIREDGARIIVSYGAGDPRGDADEA